MGVRVYSVKETSAAWDIDERWTSQAFDPFYEKLVKLARKDKTKLVGLVHMACDEADQQDFETELPLREDRLNGRANSVRVAQR